ncbi:MAG: long-chain fatty acid--CoA ligase [Candidatus Aphodousia sp.]|nr:long-chain fatty acid--CoA ligase [Sutterella sp.]MDY2899467.1 long-chain fatty acid--CoA ligase [Candidatus Aphodousia sp.]
MADTSQTRFEALSRLKTLDQFIPARTAVAPHTEALRQFDRRSNTWERISYRDLSERIMVWRRAFAKLGLKRGDRVAILLPNGVDSVCCDQAVLANGYVPVPLHAIDTAGSSAYIIADSEAKVLVTTRQNRWDSIYLAHTVMPKLKEVIFTEESAPERRNDGVRHWDLENWLATGHDVTELPEGPQEDDLAAIVYTSGTTGRPKGVMLTHKNVVSNVVNTLKTVLPSPGSIFLSFLPVSHTFERQCGYYLALGMGCTIVYTRSIQQLAEDFRIVRPNVIISVPRIYERIYAKVQAKLARESAFVRFMFNWAVEVGWRRFCKRFGMPVEKSSTSWLDPIVWPILDRLVSRTLLDQFGGQVQVAISGGAALSSKIAKVFCGLGLVITQGYGMTESSPIIAGNSTTYNHPHTVGKPLPGTQVRLGEDNEIQVKSDSIMKGYWNRPEDTKQAFTEDGWFRTGDVGEFDEEGYLRIVGRIKEIIVTSTGEKVPPADLEQAIEIDPLFEQSYVIGENRPFISTIIVLNKEEWKKLAATLNLDPLDPESLHATITRNAVLKRIKAAAKDFPQYALPRNVWLTLEPWTIDNELLTPTLKLKRKALAQKFAPQIQTLYAGHR